MRCSILCSALFVLSCLAAGSVNAQDKIYLIDGTRVDARVMEIGPRDVRYIQWQSKDSAEYEVAKRDVERIVFENGMEQSFGSRSLSPHERMMSRRPALNTPRKRGASDEAYGKNILCFAPMQMTNESVAGVGIQYERVLDKNGYISLLLPVAFSFVQNSGYNYNGQWNDKSSIFTNLYPGLKFYPATSNHRVTYSIGPSFGLGFGTMYHAVSQYDPITGSYATYWEGRDVFKAGFMVNNGLNVQITSAFYLGLEGGLGIYYYDNEYEHFELGGDEPMVQLNFKMGYRF